MITRYSGRPVEYEIEMTKYIEDVFIRRAWYLDREEEALDEYELTELERQEVLAITEEHYMHQVAMAERNGEGDR